MKMHLAIAASALTLTLGANTAQSATLTGTVAYFFTQDYAGVNNYTFVNLQTPSGNAIAYYTGDNTAVATVIDNARRHNATITIVTDNNYKITQVR